MVKLQITIPTLLLSLVVVASWIEVSLLNFLTLYSSADLDSLLEHKENVTFATTIFSKDHVDFKDGRSITAL